MNDTSKNKVLILVIAFLLLTNISMIVFCVLRSPERRPPHQEDRRHGDGISDVFRKQLNFNDEQLKQFEQLRSSHWKQMKPLFDSIRVAKQDFYKLVKQPNVPDSVFRRAANRIGEAQQTIDMELFAHFKRVRGICTPEQLPKYDSLVLSVTGMMFAPRKGGGALRRDSTQPR